MAKELNKALSHLKKSLGIDQFPTPNVEFWETPWPNFNGILGGGLVRGRLLEVAGRPESGKTTLALQLAAHYLKTEDRAVVYLDFEHTVDPVYALKLGIDFSNDDRVIYMKPKTLEDGFEAAYSLIQTNEIGLLLADSIHAMVPEADIKENKIGNQIALQARRLGEAIRRLVSMLDRSKAMFVFLNHVSQTIGMYSTTTTPGGKAIKHYSTHRFQLRRKKSNYFPDNKSHGLITFRLIRSKVSPVQYAELEVEIAPNRGFIPHLSVFPIIRNNYLEVKKPWYNINIPGKVDEKFQGKEALLDFLMDHSELCWDILSENGRNNDIV
jgi:recombination protein RecA